MPVEMKDIPECAERGIPGLIAAKPGRHPNPLPNIK
jgi:hypothetical protein